MYVATGLAAKLYVPEQESQAMQDLVATCRQPSCSELLLTEFGSVLSRYHRDEGLSSADQRLIWAAFERHVEQGHWNLVPICRDVLLEAKRLIWECQQIVALRPLDAVHLATCLHFGLVPLYTTDRRMRRAAVHVGIPLGRFPVGGPERT